VRVDKNSISELSSAIVDNGRRGEPRAGCDCMQCFGYCIIDTDQAVREQALRNDARRGTIGDGLPAAVDQVLA
jgi:hypothetical protein